MKRFTVQLGLRLGVLFLCLLGVAFGIAFDTRVSLLVLLGIVTLVLAWSIVRYINHTNRELESFLAGLRYGDFQQTYTIGHLGPSFRNLEDTLKSAVSKFKEMRSEQEQHALYYRSLMQHMPIPFFIVKPDQRVEVLNLATRRTFNVADITHTRELTRFGASFQQDVLHIDPGEALLTTIELGDNREYFIMTATDLTVGGAIHKLVALQNVQGEIDATELATWQNLLRVTSHEILNSLAPVSSCAQTAQSLVDDLIARHRDDPHLSREHLDEEMRDIRESVETVLRRSEGLTRFIQSYRQLSRMPPPKKKRIAFDNYFRRLESLVRGELARKDVELMLNHHPQSLHVVADEDMLDQLLINLIRNASDALIETENARIEVSAFQDDRQRTVIDVIDNGPGIPEELLDKIFVPFFTTRDEGSGIGLALTRYIMLSHGGKVTCLPGHDQGTVFRLVF